MPSSHSEPGGRQPAPPRLRMVQEFLNSADALTRRETLDSPADLERWMRRHGLDPGPRPLRRQDLLRAIRLREALRGIAAGHNRRPTSEKDTRYLNRETATAKWQVSFDADGRPEAQAQGSGVSGLVAALVGAAVRSAEDGTWPRLKACPACGWVFFDHSRNRRGHWCTMAICGSRAKMRALRRRRLLAQPDQAVGE